MCHMGGLDESVDLAMFLGYHSMSGTLHGVMAHTFAGYVYALSFNGREVGEIGADAALCGAHGVPVGLVAGDRAACEEARELLGNVQTVAVKEGLSRSSAVCLPIAKAREMIEEAAGRAVARAAEFKPFTFDGPVEVRIAFIDPSYADVLEHLDFVTRVDGRTIVTVAPDYVSAFERFSALHYLAPAVR